RLTGSWSQGTGGCTGSSSQTATWNQRSSGTNWSSGGGDFSSTVYANAQIGTTIKYYSWNITTLVQEWVNGTTNHGLLFKNSTESGAGSHEFNSVEETANKPIITITYTLDPPGGPVLHTQDQKTASGSGNSVNISRPD